MKYPMQTHTAESLQSVVGQAFEKANAVAEEHGVGLVVVVVDAMERVHYQTNLGPTMTAGAFSRCAGLYDGLPMAMLRGSVTPSNIWGEGMPGGGGSVEKTIGIGFYSVESDPSSVGGAGRIRGEK